MRPALRTLLVEDSPVQSEAIAKAVTEYGDAEIVTHVTTEDQALAACDADEFDLAVIDLQLAQGTGFGVLRRLHRRTEPRAILIVFTNHAVPALKVAAFEAGADYFLDKARGIADLRRIVLEIREARA